MLQAQGEKTPRLNADRLSASQIHKHFIVFTNTHIHTSKTYTAAQVVVYVREVKSFFLSTLTCIATPIAKIGASAGNRGGWKLVISDAREHAKVAISAM